MEFIDMLLELRYENADEIIARRMEKSNCLDRFNSQILRVKSSMDLGVNHIPGFNVSVLIVADRLFELGIGLAYFMNKKTDANVVGVVEHYSQSKDLLLNKIDILLFCGYQSCMENYTIIADTRKQNPPPVVAIYANLDAPVHEVCSKYGIELMYHSQNRMSWLVSYLKDKCC